MKTVGIIGGLGPETTSKFYLEIIFGCYERNKVSRPPILIWNVPLKYEIEKDLIVDAKGEERYIPYLIDAAKRLEKGGADFLVMPCNSLHIFIDKIRNSVKVPVLSIVEETVKFLKYKRVSKVGILANATLLKHKLYEDTFKKENIEQIVPEKTDQEKIGILINKLVLNEYSDKDKAELLNIIGRFKKNDLKSIILACTDLQLLVRHNSELMIFDTMKIFAEATVDKILEQ